MTTPIGTLEQEVTALAHCLMAAGLNHRQREAVQVQMGRLLNAAANQWTLELRKTFDLPTLTAVTDNTDGAS